MKYSPRKRQSQIDKSEFMSMSISNWHKSTFVNRRCDVWDSIPNRQKPVVGDFQTLSLAGALVLPVGSPESSLSFTKARSLMLSQKIWHELLDRN